MICPTRPSVTDYPHCQSLAVSVHPTPVKTLNPLILLGLALATGRLFAVDFDAGGPPSPSVDRARRLAVPADATEYRSAIHEMSLFSGYRSSFRDPNAPARPRSARRVTREPFHVAPPRIRMEHATQGERIPGSADFDTSVRAPSVIEYNFPQGEGIVDPQFEGGIRLWAVVATEAAAGFPGEVIEEVIVPVPSEIFAVMDKLGRPDWRGELRREKTPTFSNRVDVALLLGSVVAEGFVAVQAEDKEAVERIGKDVLRLSESLGLKDTVLPHTNSILEASKNSHWEIVRVELDKTQKTVRDTMEQRRDAELGQCVSLGGWLRGTDAVTSLITKNYTSDAAELLNQPDIIRHFQKELKKLATRNGKLKALLDGLTVMAGVIGDGDEPPNAAGVKTIHETAGRLVKSINSSASSAQ